jgi:hypothetical protein
MNKTETRIVVESVEPNTFKPEIAQAMLRQIVTSHYAARSVTTGGLYDEADFNLETQDFENNRVAWIDVPLTATVAEVQAKIDAMPNSRLQKTLSMKPILTTNQLIGIQRGLTTMEAIAEKQTVRDEDGNIILWNGKPQYRINSFNASGAADVDLRPTRIVEAKIEENVEVAAAATK